MISLNIHVLKETIVLKELQSQPSAQLVLGTQKQEAGVLHHAKLVLLVISVQSNQKLSQFAQPVHSVQGNSSLFHT
jgi:hypothetical protein